jgi:CMP-N-acetylneuraminic acid synthetase|tara:strand:- start:577 stop:1272 length:696 start_codon:yes stop_codon:yes gene_type:complete
MRPICFIGARGGSKGVPRKNIRLLAGKPLIAHTIESALDSQIFSKIIVSTEDLEIAKIAKKYGADVPFMRPKKLATDTADMYEVIIHAIKKMKKLGYDLNILVNRDCTVPFIKNEDIKKSIELLKRKKCHMVCGVYRQHHNPYFNMMELNSKGFLKFSKKLGQEIKQRQDAPIVYQLNGLFTINVDSLLRYKKFYMPKVLPYEIPPETGLMIDTEFEFQIADMIASNKIKI